MNKLRIKYDKILKRKYGYDNLKNEQFAIINTIVNDKKDVLAILATGFGKSICYQMPYLITKKSVLVVSPLIALMTDQEEELKKLKIPVCVLNSTCKNKAEVIDEILTGNNKIIYTTPEFLEVNQSFLQLLVENDQLCLIAIDEAHCVSTWGLDFRTAYTKLTNIRDWIDDSIPILAVTATASKKVRKDISKMLQLNDPEIIIGDFDRKNLYISVQKRIKNDNGLFLELLEKYKDEYIIIYCKTREDTEKISDLINNNGIKCDSYHAGFSSKTRDEIQKKFIEGQIKCIVATVAFGMGINIKNVRLVIHYNCPKNLESYYQEIGRAGRDGKPSECYLFYSKKDFIINKLFLDSIKEPRHKTYQEEQIKAIERFVNSSLCRRYNILKNFDENYSKLTCDNCDICMNNSDNSSNNSSISSNKIKIKKDYTIQAFIILDLINNLNGRYGTNTYINILRGSKAKNITQVMKNQKYYGLGKSYSLDWFKDIFNELIQEEYLNEKSIQAYMGSVLECTKKTKEFLKKIKEKYDIIETFESNVKINDNDKDKVLLKESKLMISISSKNKSLLGDNIFTDDILTRFNIDIHNNGDGECKDNDGDNGNF